MGHEIRLSVVRTKLEVHDQKLAQLDRSVRWRGTDTERSSPASPAHVAAQHKPRAAHELVGDGALGFDNVRAEVHLSQMTLHVFSSLGETKDDCFPGAHC